jgi:hypothetical protein
VLLLQDSHFFPQPVFRTPLLILLSLDKAAPVRNDRNTCIFSLATHRKRDKMNREGIEKCPQKNSKSVRISKSVKSGLRRRNCKDSKANTE